MGQASYFVQYAAEPRYTSESRRLLTVLETHLTTNKFEYIVANKFTIADMACVPWVVSSAWCGVELDDFPAVSAWCARVYSRPMVTKAFGIPSQYPWVDELVKDPAGEDFRNAVRGAGRVMMAEGTEKFYKEPRK